ncbi:MAG TPA: serine protease [Porphyromonadaceae bacterium]|jgi:membrane-bound serine protease (ClpP class)|nr:serine protease [Porphyromonadaceae bacterium]HBX46191.1 serine protease [Porphyromonadaceae bacterium]
MRNIRATILFIFFFVGFVSSAQENAKPLIYRINIRENIGSNTWIYLRNGLHEAVQLQAECVLLDMNTYGGAVLEADSMRTAILESPLPVYVFINNNAASAGALIAIACDRIFMRPGASIGAATVVNAADGAKAPDKYQSYMRAIIRATAESHGHDTLVEGKDTIIQWIRDPKVAEAMVDERIVVPGYADSTQILTLTPAQAMELGYCDGIASTLHHVAVQYLGYNDYELKTYNATFYDRIKGFLMNGIIQSLLIMLIIGGIYFELQSPGVGFPLAVAIAAALLYFTPLYLTGYAQNWEVLLFVLGLIAMVFELLVVPGFGVTGIVGILFIVSGLLLALIGNIRFHFDGLPVMQLFRALVIVFAGLGLGSVLIVYLSSRIGKPGFFRKVALLADQKGTVSVSMEPASMVGKIGVSVTGLRPSGRIRIEGELYDAVSVKGFIEQDEPVKVIRYENFQLYVMKQ